MNGSGEILVPYGSAIAESLFIRKEVVQVSNYVLTLKLQTSNFHADLINKRLEIARNIYNANVREIIKRDRKMRHDPEYRKIKDIEKKADRNKVYRALRDKYQVSKYAMMKFTTPMNRYFSENIPADVGHNQAARAFQAYEKVRFADGKQMRFKKYGEVNSLEGKSNTGIAYKDGHIFFNTRKSNVKCIIPVKFYKNDDYQQNALHDDFQYCRILRKEIKGKYQYFVQLVMEGMPPNPHIDTFSNTENTRVGIDIGTSTVAVASKNAVMLKVLSEDIYNKDQEIERLTRKMDRQRRANNPSKYADDGTFIKNNQKWHHSKRYQQTRAKKQHLHRSMREQRRISHQTLANVIMSLGTDIRVEKMDFKALQAKVKETTVNDKTGKYNSKKRFGKSLALHAPGFLMADINKKLHYIDQELNEVNTHKVKASQYNHVDDTYVKKQLSDRWNTLDGEKVQRDLYSAFLIMNTDDHLETIDRNLCRQTYNQFKNQHDQYLQNVKEQNVRHHCFG